MIRSSYRLKKTECERVYKKGRSIRQGNLLVRILKNNLQYSRFAIVISKAISPKATQRNRLRRKTFDIIKKLNLNKILSGGSDIIISFKGQVQEEELEPLIKIIFSLK